MRYMMFELNPFDYSSKYTIIDGDDRVENSTSLPGGLNVTQLGQALAIQARNFNIDTIEILCMDGFYEELEKTILETEKKNFGENKLIVERIVS